MLRLDRERDISEGAGEAVRPGICWFVPDLVRIAEARGLEGSVGVLRCFSVTFDPFEVTLVDRWREANVEVYNLEVGFTTGIEMGPDTDRGVDALEALLDDLLWLLPIEAPDTDLLAFGGGGARNFGVEVEEEAECLGAEGRLGGPGTGFGVVALLLTRPLLTTLGGRDFSSAMRSSAIAHSSSQV